MTHLDPVLTLNQITNTERNDIWALQVEVCEPNLNDTARGNPDYDDNSDNDDDGDNDNDNDDT